MSQSINNFDQAPQSGYKWELSSLKRICSHKKQTSFDLLPLERIPILAMGSRYTLRFKGIWQGAPEACRNVQPPEVALNTRGRGRGPAKKDDFILGDVKLLTTSLTATASISVKVNTNRLMPGWNLFVDGQCVLKNVRVLHRVGRFHTLLWRAQKRWQTHKTWQKESFSEAPPLYFSSVLRRECEENTELWQRLIEQIVSWAKTNRSRPARAVQADLGMTDDLVSQTSMPSRTPATNQHEGSLGTTQALPQPSASDLSQPAYDSHATFNVQPIPVSQVAYPPMSQFHVSSSLSQEHKRKRPSLNTTTNAQKRRRTTLIARLNSLAQMPVYSSSARTFLPPPPAAAPTSFLGFSPLAPSLSNVPANQLSSVDPIQSPSADTEEYLREDEMQNFLHQNSVNLPAQLGRESESSNPQNLVGAQSVPVTQTTASLASFLSPRTFPPMRNVLTPLTATEQHNSALGVIQTHYQPTSTSSLQLRSNLHGTVGAQVIPASQAAWSEPGPSEGELILSSSQASNQLSSADPMQSASINGEGSLGEDEMQSFLQEHSVDPTQPLAG